MMRLNIVGAAALAAVMLLGCAPTAPTPRPAAVPAPAGSPRPLSAGALATATPAPAAPVAAPCVAATTTTEALPAPFLTPVGRGPVGVAWTGYRSPDRLIWVSNLPTHSGGSHKVLWLKPPGSVLRVTGRRLDGDAPPLTAQLPDGYGGDFQASGIGFPTPGCWEVEARAGESSLRFVVAISDRSTSWSRGRVALAEELLDQGERGRGQLQPF
jgi:hypothetical protein